MTTAVEWIQTHLQPRPATSDQVIYDHQESQSDFGLPLVYQPFDPEARLHWQDRGYILDFAAAAAGGDVLDPGRATAGRRCRWRLSPGR